MKKVFLLLFAFILMVGCSSEKEETNLVTGEKFEQVVQTVKNHNAGFRDRSNCHTTESFNHGGGWYSYYVQCDDGWYTATNCNGTWHVQKRSTDTSLLMPPPYPCR